jgi:O-antigen/teichoic acid export membrane protein
VPYPRSEDAFRILAIALPIAFVNNAFIGALNASDRQVSFTWAAGWSVLVNVGLNLILIPTVGFVGAAWATVVTEVALGVVAWMLTARHIGRVPVVSMSWRVILAGLVMGVVIFPFQGLSGFWIAIPMVVGVAVYAASVLLLRALSVEEIGWARRALALAR